MLSKNILLFILLILLSTSNCRQSFEPAKNCDCDSNNNSINIIFGYGVGAQNILNTFDCKFTKDQVLDPDISTCLILNTNELDTILHKIQDIDLFSFPDTFAIQDTTGIVGIVTPALTYKIYIEYQNEKKKLYWKDEIANESTEADKLRELFQLIKEIIYSKDEYKKLPPARGGYI